MNLGIDYLIVCFIFDLLSIYIVAFMNLGIDYLTVNFYMIFTSGWANRLQRVHSNDEEGQCWCSRKENNEEQLALESWRTLEPQQNLVHIRSPCWYILMESEVLDASLISWSYLRC